MMGMFRWSKFLMVAVVTAVILIGLSGLTSIDLGDDAIAGEGWQSWDSKLKQKLREKGLQHDDLTIGEVDYGLENSGVEGTRGAEGETTNPCGEGRVCCKYSSSGRSCLECTDRASSCA